MENENDKLKEAQENRARFLAHFARAFPMKSQSWQSRAIVMQTTRAYQTGGWRKQLQNDQGLRTFVQRK